MRKVFAYILLAFHVFTAGNFGIISNHYFSIASAASTTISYSGTATDLGDSTQGWVTPSNATGDTTNTSANMDIADRDVNTNTLSLTNFNLSAAGIPSGSIINGISVDVEWETESRRVQDSRVQLTKDGTTGVGNDYANNAAGPTTKTITNYGGTTDLWGTTWTVADLTSSDFGVLLQYVNTRNRDRFVYVYRVAVTIEYTTLNNIPTDVILSNNSINEGLPIGTTIGSLTTVDPDVLDTHTYSLSCSTPGVDDASFAISGANLNSNAIYDHGTKSTYNICIRTDDGNGGTFDKNFTVNVTEVITVAPGGVDTNLSVWLKADKGTSTDINGIGLNVWSDQSGNNLDATAILAPTYLDGNNAFSNFNPIIDFDGADDYMSNLANGSFTDSYFLVIIPDNIIEGTTSQGVPFGWDCFSGNLNTGTCGLNFSGLALGAFTAAFPDEVLTHAIGSSANWRSSKTAIATYDANKPLILGVNENATANGTDLYSDGIQVNNASINTYQTVSNADYTLGRSGDNTYPFYYDGKIAEVINYSSRISDTERQQIESYLALKYGVTLNNGTQNYTASDGSTLMWSNTIAGGYLSNIFGIGRDDNQELSQLKSKSINNDAIVMIEADGEGSNIAPSFIDIADREFLTISNNGSGNTWASVGAPTGHNILSRKWKSQEVGDTGNITLEFNVADPDFDVPSLNAGTNYYIVYDSNGNSDLSDETPTALTNTAGDLWRLSGVNIAHNRIFTLATEASSNNIPTDISLSSNSVNENIILGSTVGVFSTTDIDTGDSHTYTFASGAGDDDNNRFSISGNSLNINHSPDHEIQETYTIRINTNDGNGGQYQESFIININDIGESITSTIDLEDVEDDFKYTTTSGQWNKTTTNPNTGSLSLESDNLGVGGTQSCFEVTHNSNDIGTIEFQYAVSSEAGSDFLRFYIDDVEQDAWSGTIPYTQYTSGDIAAGSHNYKWCYIKDGAGNVGTDNAFIDDINFKSNVTDVITPIISSTSFASGSLLPGGTHDITINYSDADSGINTATASLELYKWDGTSAYGPDISGASITTNTVTTTSASYSTNGLDFGKYRYSFTIQDVAGNSTTETVDFYIDIPEFTISTGSIDIGTVNHIDNSFSDTVTVTVRTLGAGFSVYMNTASPLIDGVEQIDAWDGNKGFGYDPDPFTTNISTIGANQAIGTQAGSINTNGDMNVYTFDIKIGALVEEFQTSGDYEGDIDFGVIFDY